MGSYFRSSSARQDAVCVLFHAVVTASSMSCISGDVKPAMQRIKLGMESVSKGVASKVTLGRDQILCSRILSVVVCEMPEARKVMRGWLGVEVGVGVRGGTGGGAILASGSLSLVAAAISSIAFLKRPERAGCLVFCSLPSYPKNQMKNFGWHTSHQVLTVL